MMTTQQQAKATLGIRQFAYWKNLIAATYYLALLLLFAYLFGGIADLELTSIIHNGLNAVFILLQQLFSSIVANVTSVV